MVNVPVILFCMFEKKVVMARFAVKSSLTSFNGKLNKLIKLNKIIVCVIALLNIGA